MAEYYDELPDEDINKWDHGWREGKRREEKRRKGLNLVMILYLNTYTSSNIMIVNPNDLLLTSLVNITTIQQQQLRDYIADVDDLIN